MTTTYTTKMQGGFNTVRAPREGFKIVAELTDQRIVAMVTFKGQVLVATEHRMYKLHSDGDMLVPVQFEVEDLTS